MQKTINKDIFADCNAKTQIIIPINSSVDYIVSSEIIDENSLHGQLITEMTEDGFFKETKTDFFNHKGEPITDEDRRTSQRKELANSRGETLLPLGSFKHVGCYSLIVATHFDKDGYSYLSPSPKGANQSYEQVLTGLTSLIKSKPQKMYRIPIICDSLLSRTEDKSFGIKERKGMFFNKIKEFREKGYNIDIYHKE